MTRGLRVHAWWLHGRNAHEEASGTANPPQSVCENSPGGARGDLLSFQGLVNVRSAHIDSTTRNRLYCRRSLDSRHCCRRQRIAQSHVEQGGSQMVMAAATHDDLHADLLVSYIVVFEHIDFAPEGR